MKPFLPEDPQLQAVVEKVLAGRRLDREDGLALYRTHDLLSLGRLADYVREQRHGKRAYCRAHFDTAPPTPAPPDAETGVQALLELRARQDQSPELSVYEAPAAEEHTGFTHLKNIAVARLLLDNVPHICVRLTPAAANVSQVALRFGADTITGPDPREQERLVRAAGREPVFEL